MADLTADLIADLSIPREPQLTPNGRLVAYTLTPLSKREEHKTSAIWVAPTDGSSPPKRFTAGTARDHSPKWSPDGTQLAFLSDRAVRGTAQLYLIGADGGEAEALTDAKSKKSIDSFSWSPGGGQIAFTSSDLPTDEDERRERERDDAEVYGERWPYARLRLLSVATREVTTVVTGDHHVAVFAWSPQGTELAYLLWQAPALEYAGRGNVIERIPLAGGGSQVVCRLPTGGGADNLLWSNDGETIFFVAAAAPKSQSSRAVYAVPAQGGEPRRVALGEESCAGNLEQPPGSPRAVVEVGRGLDTELHWLEPQSGALEPLYPAESRGGDVSGWSVRSLPDGSTALAVVRSAGHEPWEVWAGRSDAPTEAATPQKISTHQTSLEGLTFGQQEPFTWTAPDGWSLDGLLVRPPDAPTDQPLPTVVLVHGGPYGRWGSGLHLSWADWTQWLALVGYAVLLPNPRGGYGHGEHFAGAVRGAVGKEDYSDVMTMVDAAVEQGIADPDRLGIGGWSQGGFVSAWAVTRTDRFKAAIMGAGVSDWGMMVMTSDVPDFERELGGSAPWGGSGPHAHAAISPISFASQVSTPVLILHGEKDARVPLSQAVGFHRALREYGVPTELVVYPREPHGVEERAHQIDLLGRVRAWYDRWLKV